MTDKHWFGPYEFVLQLIEANMNQMPGIPRDNKPFMITIIIDSCYSGAWAEDYQYLAKKYVEYLPKNLKVNLR